MRSGASPFSFYWQSPKQHCPLWMERKFRYISLSAETDLESYVVMSGGSASEVLQQLVFNLSHLFLHARKSQLFYRKCVVKIVVRPTDLVGLNRGGHFLWWGVPVLCPAP